MARVQAPSPSPPSAVHTCWFSHSPIPTKSQRAAAWPLPATRPDRSCRISRRRRRRRTPAPPITSDRCVSFFISNPIRRRKARPPFSREAVDQCLKFFLPRRVFKTCGSPFFSDGTNKFPKKPTIPLFTRWSSPPSTPTGFGPKGIKALVFCDASGLFTFSSSAFRIIVCEQITAYLNVFFSCYLGCFFYN